MMMTPLQPTLHLIERQARMCRLSPAEVEFLLAQHRSVIEVLPSAQRHVYRVTPSGVAGVIVTPRRRIVISSKVPLGNLLFLVDPLADLPGDRDRVQQQQQQSGSEVIDLLAGQLALRMSERAAAGLHRGYRETANVSGWLVGQLDMAAQLRQPPGRKDQIHSRQDEYTIDLPCNQVPRSVAGLLLAQGLLSPAVRARLAGALPAFAEVAFVPLAPEVLCRLQSERVPAEYVPLIDLCLLLAHCLGPTPAGGIVPAPAFLLPLERVFEQYLTRAVQDAFAAEDAARVLVQESWSASEPMIAGQPSIHIRPDVSIDCKGRVVLVVDAKWKRLPAEAVVTEDLYQMLAYGAVLGSPMAVLVYPGRRRRRVWEYAFEHSATRVQIRTLDVSGTAEQCAKARRRLGRDLRRLVRG
jgi:5-methylcytosine-specific restriction endonuclease McrBC regulatory subunit McrC